MCVYDTTSKRQSVISALICLPTLSVCQVRLNGAEGMALLYKVEKSTAEMLCHAAGRMELKTAGLLLLKLQTATWVKQEGLAMRKKEVGGRCTLANWHHINLTRSQLERKQ